MRKVWGFILSCGLVACVHEDSMLKNRGLASLEGPRAAEGIWDLQGSNNPRGPYTGELELRRLSNGTYHAIRTINYISFYYQGLRVQEVWTGLAVPNKSGVVVTYDLATSDFITQLGTEKRTPEDLAGPLTLNEFFNLTDKNTFEAKFSDRREAIYHEWITTKRDLQSQPLWKSERSSINLTGQKNGKLFQIKDPTDYSFYRENIEALRVNNKPIDNISLAESLLRRNAYALPLSEKAKGFERKLQSEHINANGLVVSDLEKPMGGDVFLTSMYVASLSARYLKTRNAEALAHLKKSLGGLCKKDAKDFEEIQFESLMHASVWAMPIVEKDPLFQLCFRSFAEHIKQKSQRSHNDDFHRIATEYGRFIGKEARSSGPAALELPLKNRKGGAIHWTQLNRNILNKGTELLIAQQTNDSLFLQQIENEMTTLAKSFPYLKPTLLLVVGNAAHAPPFGRVLASQNLASEELSKENQNLVTQLKEMPFPKLSEDIQFSHHQGPADQTAFPLFEGPALANDWAWFESPFVSEGNLAKATQKPGIDYIYAYWLAQYSGLNIE